ncbi:MAG: hypothetical protein HZB38_03495 [Planctomycetes bacterium]|nr:hypothetical protein [Planctomycetota bacterium]
MRFEAVFTAGDIAEKAMSATVTHSIRARRDGVASVELNAVGMTIQTVAVGEPPKPAEFSYDEDQLTIRLPRRLRVGDEEHIRIKYRVENPRLGLHFVGELADDDFVIYSNAEPLQARYWLPCHDWPDTRWRGIDAIFTVPTGLRCVAVGEPAKAEPPPTNEARFAWRLDVPIDPHLFGFAIGRYEEIQCESAGVPIFMYTQAEYAEQAKEAFADAPATLAHFAKLTGTPYPFPRYSHVVVPKHFHGGMEHAGLDMIAPTSFTANPRADWVRYSYLAHMAAHQWFAGIVNYRHITEAWVNEGFGTYLHMLWQAEIDGPKALRRELARSRGMVGRFDRAGRSRPMVNEEIARPVDIYGFGGGLIYWKGAWVLHMLRRELGDETFWRGVHRLLEQHRFDAIDTADLRSAFEYVSVRDLRPFFDQWSYRDGVPRLLVTHAWNAEEKSLRVEIEQRQRIDDAHPPFDLPLELRFKVGDTDHDERMRITSRKTTVEIPLPGQPSSVLADPEVWLLANIDVQDRTIK